MLIWIDYINWFAFYSINNFYALKMLYVVNVKCCSLHDKLTLWGLWA